MNNVKFNLPLCPSLSECFINNPRAGRVKSPKYRAWIKEASQEIMLQRMEQAPKSVPANAKAEILVLLPPRKGRDADNRLKASIDILTQMQVITDDSWPHVAEVTARFIEEMATKRQVVWVKWKG